MLSSVAKSVTVGDKTYKFNRITLQDQFHFTEAEMAFRVALAKEEAKTLNLQPQQLMNLLIQIKSVKITIDNIYDACSNPQFAVKILKFSLTKGGTTSEAEQDAVISSLGSMDAINLAQDLILDKQQIPPSDDKSGTEDKKESPLT